MRFYLGTHKAVWLERYDVPLFVSRRTLAGRRSLPRALGPWALDSGGFTELGTYGRWTLSAEDYAADVDRFATEIGRLEWAAPQDWMVEPQMLERTGLTVRDHQERTVSNYLELRALAPHLPIAPVLQGWTLGDYERCVELYAEAGVDLRAQPLVGIGSVCRRQNTAEIRTVVREIAGHGIRLHGFGVKVLGLGAYAEHLASSDSLAWSFQARKRPPLPGCTHRSCANCPRYALRWRERLLEALEQRHEQGALW